MRALDLRADEGNRERATACARRFFTALHRGDWAGASQRCSDPFLLFGRSMPRERLAAGAGSAFDGPILEVHTLPPEVLARFEGEVQEQVFGQPLTATDGVLFATVPLLADDGGEQATYGVIVDLSRPSEPLLRALFDPAAFKTLTEWLRAELDKGEASGT